MDGNDSATFTELDTDAENDLFDIGLIWKGYYTFSLQHQPQHPYSGWVYDTEKDAEFPVPLEGKSKDLRNRHGVFNLHPETALLQLFSRSSKSGRYGVSVDGESVGPGKTRLLA